MREPGAVGLRFMALKSAGGSQIEKPQHEPCSRVVVFTHSTEEHLMAASTQPTNVRETVSLIGSDKVENTPVYRSNGKQVGTIQRVMIEKLSGKVAYAVMSFGGFMGIGEDPCPCRKASAE